ncbi:hypothetical protein FSP39_023659 [Pinctada imbricata]|uniref:Uncharacterized protein n=1 Tax=Pinctada imbricata TaxID=66713 RepID=A0AA89CAB2_PINIB|nr:hypothetical protein FSP39_023659 [Pinctada imbricata]
MKFLAFGYEAEDIYNMLVDNEENSDHRFFTRFKMILFNQQNIKKDVMIKDTNGRPCLALSVFSHSICYLKNHLIERLEGLENCRLNPDQDIQWVLTVPAIWNDSAKQFMREAAMKVR